MSKVKAIGCLFILTCMGYDSQSQIVAEDFPIEKIDIAGLMEDGDIPGLSVVIIKGDMRLIRSYGYSDLKTKKPVTPFTLFQLGSCSKAFTALAIESLVHQKKLRLDAFVSDYIPWFQVNYRNKSVKIKVKHLLHHTSGIPWNTISRIPETNRDDGLEQTIRCLIGQKLNRFPGKKFEYATINYDVLALIVEYITKQSFERYMDNIFQALCLKNTTIGVPLDSSLMSTGYKIGFFNPREYNAPVYRGNFAAGYVISDAEDIAHWLNVQLGGINSEMAYLARLTHERDETVALHGMSSYAKGWEVSLNGSGEIYHGGVNPNFTAFVAFRPKEKIGVAVMANSNSGYTSLIGSRIMRLLAGEDEDLIKGEMPDDNYDKNYSIFSLVLAVYILGVFGYLWLIVSDLIEKKRRFEHFTIIKFRKFAKSLVILLPFLFGLYILPEAIAGFTWRSMLVWSPESLRILVLLILVGIVSSYLAYIISLCFPEDKNYNYKGIAIQTLLMSILSGLSNVVIIIMVTSVIEIETEQKKYLVFYYILAIGLYLFGRRFVQINLVKFTRRIIWDLTTRLTDKIFSTTYQKFEKIDRGRVYTALNDDVNTIGQSTSIITTLITSIITVVGAFLYLASIAFWAALLTIFIIVTLSSTYHYVSITTNIYFKKARDSRDVFMRLINGMIDGFKEISLHMSRKLDYKHDMTLSATEYREKITIADIRFVNAFLVGESLLVILLGSVAFGMTELFPDIKYYTIMNFVVILLYLIGPINGILNAVPSFVHLRIAWNRLQEFIKEIPANLDLAAAPRSNPQYVESIEAKDVVFRYGKLGDVDGFSIGPVNLEARKGEIVFIIGGNGSGKTTFAKLITGLYNPDEGQFMINKEPVDARQLGEYFSVVFSPPQLFEKLYGIDMKDKSIDIDGYLRYMDLCGKVEVIGDRYSTIDLSGGQRKRLALLQCYLEDRPIYLFDEWAADQDPEFRKFFYCNVLTEMKKTGKIVIAITHDENYFHVADRVLRMYQGKLESFFSENSLTAIR